MTSSAPSSSTPLVTLTRHGDIAVLSIANPPVNALSQGVVDGLAAAIDAFEADRSYRALLVLGAGRTFVAGGDINSFDDPHFSAALYNGTLGRIESLDRPVAAALHANKFHADNSFFNQISNKMMSNVNVFCAGMLNRIF